MNLNLNLNININIKIKIKIRIKIKIKHYGTTALRHQRRIKNKRKTAKSEKSPKSAALPTSLMSFLFMICNSKSALLCLLYLSVFLFFECSKFQVRVLFPPASNNFSTFSLFLEWMMVFNGPPRFQLIINKQKSKSRH